MKFASAALFAVVSVSAASAFTPSIGTRTSAVSFRAVSRYDASTLSSSLKMSTVEDLDVEQQNERKATKKDDRLRFMKSDQFYRKGFKEVRSSVEEVMGEQFKSSTVDELKSSNYVMQRDGVKVYLAKVRVCCCLHTREIKKIRDDVGVWCQVVSLWIFLSDA
jgi:hypothetical protein